MGLDLGLIDFSEGDSGFPEDYTQDEHTMENSSGIMTFDEEAEEIEEQEEEKEEVNPTSEVEEEEIEETEQVEVKEEEGDEEEKEEEEQNDGKEESDDLEVDEEVLKEILINQGTLTEDDLEGAETLEQAFENKGNRIAQEELRDFFTVSGEDAFDAFTAIIVNGVDPEEYFKAKSRIKKISDLDITNEDVQKRLILEYYTEHIGLSEEDALESYEQKKDYGLAEGEAKIARNFLEKKEEREVENKVAMAEAKKRAEEQRKTERIRKTSNILDEALKNKALGDLPITPEQRVKVQDYLTKEVYKNKETGEMVTEFEYFLLNLKHSDSEEFLKRAVQIALLQVSDFDFKSFEKRVISKNNKSTFSNAIKRKAIQSQRSRGSSKDNFIV